MGCRADGYFVKIYKYNQCSKYGHGQRNCGGVFSSMVNVYNNIYEYNG